MTDARPAPDADGTQAVDVDAALLRASTLWIIELLAVHER